MIDAAIGCFQKELGELEEIFTKIRDGVWVSTAQPNFDGMEKDEDVLAYLIVLRAVCRERITKIIDQPGVKWNDIYQRANSLCDTLSEPRNLAAIFYQHLLANGSNSALGLIPSLRELIKLDFYTASCYGEILERIGKPPIGKKVFSLLGDDNESGHGAFLNISKDLRLGPSKKRLTKLKSYKPEKYEDEDLQEEAILGALEHWRKVKAAITQEFELPHSSVRLPAKRDDLWDTLNPILLQLEGKAWADKLLPIVRGDWDELPDKAYQAVKNLWEKENAQKRDGIEQPYEEETEVEDDDIGMTRHATRVAKKITEEWREKENSQDLQDQVKMQVETIIREAEKHLGPKAAEAFENRLNVDSDKEAAKLTGISDRMYRYYKSEIKKIFLTKKYN